MKWSTCLAVGLAAFLPGCGSQVQEQVESEVKTLQVRCEALKGQNDTLKAEVDSLNTRIAGQDGRISSLKSENEALKRGWEAEHAASAQQFAQLQNDLALSRQSAAASAAALAAVARATASAAPTSPASGDGTTPSVPQTWGTHVPWAAQPGDTPAGAGGAVSTSDPALTAPPMDPQTVTEAQQLVDDLKGRISALTPQFQKAQGLAQSKISILRHATLDTRKHVPPNGGIHVIDGVEYIYNSEGKIIEPAIKKGDFRTQQDKDEAIRNAGAGALTLQKELESLQDQLAKALKKLANLQAQTRPET